MKRVSAGGGVSFSTSGGEPLLVVLLFASVVLSVVLGLLLVARLSRGYRRTGSYHLLALGVGLLFVVPVPKALNLAVSTATDLATPVVESATAGSQLAGLIAILYAIYAD